jgi:hypothetical protein
MSEAVDQRVREQVRNSSIETREAIFEDLLRELMQVEPDAQQIALVSAAGELLGYFAPASREPVGPSPDRTPEEEAEHQRRLATIDRVIDAEELIRRVTQRVRAESPSR